MAPIIKSDSGSVDSSSIISALGFTPFNETGDTLTGTGGSGFYGAIPQSSSPSTPGSGFRLYANASGLFEWKGTNGFTRTFDGATNTANRTYTLPDASGTIALTSDLTAYQPIDGDLTAIGGLSGTSGILRKTAANTWALDTNTYLTSFTETDPVFTASPAAGVTSQKITNWDTAFGWGNHASAGYQSALGFTPLNRAGDSISATNGSGFIGYPSQSGTPSTPSSGFRFYANASHALSWVGQNGFTRTFDGTANTANRAYTLPNASGTIALTSDLSSYFPVAGGSLTGTGGAGFYGAIPQSSAPSTPASGFRLYANASGLLEWKGTNGFTRTFDGSANTADRVYTLPNSSGTIALEGTLTSLANPTIQNGVYQFAQNTKPTQRAAGVPLVAGDRWYKTNDQTEWSWNGTYWLSPLQQANSGIGGVFSASYNLPYSPFPTSIGSNYLPVFVENVTLSIYLGHGTVYSYNVSNYWDVRVMMRCTDTDAGTLVVLSPTPIIPNQNGDESPYSTNKDTRSFYTINQAFGVGAVYFRQPYAFWTTISKVGTPASLQNTNCSIAYRFIYP